MLHTSFTLRPSINPGYQDDRRGVEVTFRESSQIVAPITSRRISDEGESYEQGEKCTSLGSNPHHSHHYPYSHNYHGSDSSHFPPEHALKRQRLATSGHSVSYYSPDQARMTRSDPRPHHNLPTTTVEEEYHHLPKIRRIPIEFVPPSNEDYWKRRCYRMQAICQETRGQMREMHEDQRQLRRRIQELERQLLFQASFYSTRNTTGALPEELDGAATHIVESRDCDEDHDDNEEKCTAQSSREIGNDGKKKYITPQDCRPTPPTTLTIPKYQPAASCFYLTDGEGLSDSEVFMDDGDDMDGRDDTSYQRRV